MKWDKKFNIVLCIFNFLYFIDTFSTFFLSFDSSGIFGEYNPIWSYVLNVNQFLFVFMKLILILMFDIIFLIYENKHIIYTTILLIFISLWYLFTIVLHGICWFHILF